MEQQSTAMQPWSYFPGEAPELSRFSYRRTQRGSLVAAGTGVEAKRQSCRGLRVTEWNSEAASEVVSW